MSIETRSSFHINQSSNRFPGRPFQNDDDDDDDDDDDNTDENDDAYFSSATTATAT